ncbi:lipopolysaccharide biosynthesis protein [Photobacterium leiognathi]|uniref:lipopolysaccharide biosynthesis protein n=1 Tax=Photobacterium leiognathi TaxID=553611 RepID=UPI0029812D31|nr:oligosaccharide flippase family protein [Photobacterium leiognathi]
MSNLKKNTSIYLFSNVINAAIPFLLMPVLTRYLSVDEYGKVALFQSLLLALGSVIGFNAVGAVVRKNYDQGITLSEIKEYRTNSIYVLIFSIIIIYIISNISMPMVVTYLSMSSYWVYSGIIISSFSFFVSILLSHFQVEHKANKYGFLQISRSLLNMLLTLFFVIVFMKGAQGRVDALLFSSFVFFIIAVFFIIKENLIGITLLNWEYIKDIFKYGVPLIPHTIGLFLITSVDRFLINDKLGLRDAGLYMVAVQISLAMVVIFDAINKAYMPWLFEKLKKDKAEEKIKIVKNTYIYFFSILLCCTLSFFIGPFIINIIAGSKYSDSASLIGWLCLGQGFGGMYLIITSYIFYAKKTYYLSVITIFTGFLNVIFIIFFIDYFGLVGAAIAFSLSKFIQFLLTWILSMKVIKMPWLYYE